jgi:uncharacterized surface protein with fasciclin (FAS1) repeats
LNHLHIAKISNYLLERLCMLQLKNWLASLACLTALVGCGSGHHEEPPAPKSIVETAQGTSTLSTLVAVAQFASNDNDIVNLLSNPGTLTVFAPSNAAFDALAVELTGNPSAKASDLLIAANKSLLRSVLQYHVLTTKVEVSAIPFGKAITSAQGGFFKIDSGSPPVITDGRNRKINITTTNVQATNGIVHLVDKVLLPADKTIVSTALANAPEFTALVAALQFASNENDLVTLLSSAGPFTVFAPTNAAFDALAVELTNNPNARAADILVPANKDLVRAVLQYHVLTSRVLKNDVPINAPIASALSGKTFSVSPSLVITDGRNRTINIVATDVLAANGVIHVINKVLLPN